MTVGVRRGAPSPATSMTARGWAGRTDQRIRTLSDPAPLKAGNPENFATRDIEVDALELAPGKTTYPQGRCVFRLG